MNTLTKRNIILLNIILFIGILSVFGILFFILPKKELSNFEKRKLCPAPQFSWNGFFNGKYIDSLDLYFADNFPFRDQFVETSFKIAENRGIRSEQVGFYDNEVVMNPDLEKSENKASSDSSNTLSNELEEEATRSHGIMIYKKMAIQVFGGDKYAAKHFATVVNQYREALPKEIKVYVAVTPTHGEFYLPQKYRRSSERGNIQAIYENLDDNILSVDICGELDKHTKEYIYFNTDHHWTGLGAYYAYKAFCRKARLKALPLDSLERKVKNGFLGSLYWLTRDTRLKENQDSVVYYKPRNKYTSYAYTAQNPDIAVPTTLFAEYASGPDSYGVYLGADHPLMRIETDVKTKRRVLVMKNSYGNPFSTYMVSHFERVYILDYRHFTKSIVELIEKEKITDVVFFNNTFLANTIPHTNHIQKLIKGIPKEKPKQVQPEKTIPSDTSNVLMPKDSTRGEP